MSFGAMTYEALADRLGITVASARRLALRRRWQKGKGNDGRAIVQVPEEFLQNRTDSPADRREDSPAADAETVPPAAPETVLVTDLLARLATAQGELVEMSRKLGAAESDIAALKAQADEARQRAEEIARDRDRWHEAHVAASRPWWKRLGGRASSS
jgi:hypothetical protein